jgi:hypothetical protein
MAVTADDKPAVVSLSDTEKELGSKVPDKLAGIEDPDAGLSEEEKARIVCPSSQHPCISSIGIPDFIVVLITTVADCIQMYL